MFVLLYLNFVVHIKIFRVGEIPFYINITWGVNRMNKELSYGDRPSEDLGGSECNSCYNC